MIDDNISERFPRMHWHEVAEKVGKSTYRLYTDKSMGTGFLIMVGKSPTGFMAILATAWHVLEETTKGTSLSVCDSSGKELIRSMGENIAVIEIGKGLDSAIVVIQSKEEIFRQDLLLPILPKEVQLRTGTEIGWMGYPGIVEPELCFFHGYISGILKNPPVYLVDGVAINGVSGGPVFDDRCHIVGFVSAYLPNKISASTVLPGVSWMVPINFILTWLQQNLRPADLYGKF